MAARKISFAFSIVALASISSAAVAASTDSGRRIVQRNCAGCHAVGLTGKSRHPDAPAFRDLNARYPVEMLAEALAEGMLTGHPDMPEFSFPPEQIDDIIAYLKSIQTHKNVDFTPPRQR